MKNHIFFFIFSILPYYSIAQEIDSVKHEVIYKLEKRNSNDSPIQYKILFLSNTSALEKNYDYLKTIYVQTIKRFDALGYEKRFGIHPVDQVKKMSLLIAPHEQLLYNYNAQIISYFLGLSEMLYYERPIEKLEWKISDEQIQVAGYTCQKANATSAKGEKLEVWFTKKMPYSIGLGGMTGLPGLILKGSVGSSQLSFEATDIYKGSKFFSYLETPGNAFRKVSKEELEAARDKYNKEVEELRKKAKQ